MLEIEDVLQVGAAPLVDRLVRVAHDAEVAIDLGDPANQHVLRAVRILVLVDHHEPELLGVFLPNGRRILEQLDGLEQEIVEVERAGVLEGGEVLRVDLRNRLVAPVPACSRRHLLRRLHAILRMADARERRARLDVAVVDLQILQRLLDHRQLIGRVVDHEIARQSDRRRLAPEQPRAQRVERRHPHAAAVFAKQRLDARPHLLGRLVGEGDGEHFVGPRVSVAHEICDAAGDDPGLAGPGAREDEQRAADVQHRVALLRVQGVEEVHWWNAQKGSGIGDPGTRSEYHRPRPSLRLP